MYKESNICVTIQFENTEQFLISEIATNKRKDNEHLELVESNRKLTRDTMSLENPNEIDNFFNQSEN